MREIRVKLEGMDERLKVNVRVWVASPFAYNTIKWVDSEREWQWVTDEFHCLQFVREDN